MATVGSMLDQAWQMTFELLGAARFTRAEFAEILVILVVGLVGGRITAEMVRRLLQMTPLDDMAVQANIQPLLRKMDYQGRMSDLIAGTTKYLIYVLAIMTVLVQFGMTSVLRYVRIMLSFIPRIGLALAALLLGFIIAGHMESIVVRFFRVGPLSRAIDESEATMPAYRVVGRLVRVTGYVASILISFSFLGLNPTAINLLIAIFALGLMAAFVVATADIIKNLALSMYVQTSRVLKAGQYVEIDGYEGEIAQISPLFTTLEDGSDEYLVPNTELIRSVVRKET